MSGHTHTYTQDNYSNPRCTHARRGLISDFMQAIVLIRAVVLDHNVIMHYLYVCL